MMTSWTLAWRTFAQGDVGQNFRRAAEDGRVAVDRGVAGAQADVFGTEIAAQRQPFLIDQRLDRAGVNGALALGQRLEMQGGGHERFARAGGRVEDDVLLLEQFEDGGFLGGIKLQAAFFGILQKTAQQRIVIGAHVARNQVIKGLRHGANNLRGPRADGKQEAAPQS